MISVSTNSRQWTVTFWPVRCLKSNRFARKSKVHLKTQLQVNLERTYLSAIQLEAFLGHLCSASPQSFQMKKLNLSFNNMFLVSPTTLAKFVKRLGEVKLNYCALSCDHIKEVFTEILETNTLNKLEILSMVEEGQEMTELENKLVLARKVVSNIKFTMLVRPGDW